MWMWVRPLSNKFPRFTFGDLVTDQHLRVSARSFSPGQPEPSALLYEGFAPVTLQRTRHSSRHLTTTALDMLPLIPTLVLSFVSFIASAFVILRIVIPILPPHPLSRRVPPVSVILIRAIIHVHADLPTVRIWSSQSQNPLPSRQEPYLACVL